MESRNIFDDALECELDEVTGGIVTSTTVQENLVAWGSDYSFEEVPDSLQCVSCFRDEYSSKFILSISQVAEMD